MKGATYSYKQFGGDGAGAALFGRSRSREKVAAPAPQH